MQRGRIGLAGLMAVVIGVPWAQAEEPEAVIACAHKHTGALRVVGGSGECRASEVELSWSVEGPPGPQGPPGEVPNGDVRRLAEMTGDPGFTDGLPTGISQPAGCQATLEVSALGGASGLVLGMLGTEEISRPSRYRIVLEGEPSDDWLGEPVAVHYDGEQTSATFSGVVTEVVGVGSAAGQPMAVVEFAPVAASLASNAGYRVVQGTTLPELMSDLLTDAGQPFRLRLEGAYDPLEMAVQYGESDLDFLNRHLEDAGIFYFFDPGGALVAADSNGGLDREGGTISFGDGVHGRRLSTFRSGARLDVGSATVIGFDFKNAVAPIVVTTPAGGGDPEMELFLESVDTLDRAGSRVQLELERARQEVEFAAGSSTALSVRAGRVVTIEAGPGLDGDYVVTSVRHVFTRDAAGCLSYGNAFAALPSGVKLRPQRITPRPRIPGPQTAIVVGPAGQKIHADEFGRVKIQFHWDRDGNRDEGSSAWVRVAHPAGRTGSAPPYIPEIDDEVLVVFEQGDPSRPIIVGSMYNGVDLPPPR
jgi:type VI secretion system secreted protein VgrG